MLQVPKPTGTKKFDFWLEVSLTLIQDRIILNISEDPARSAILRGDFPKNKNRSIEYAEATADLGLPWTHLGWLLAQPLLYSPISSSQKNVKASLPSISLCKSSLLPPMPIGLDDSERWRRMAFSSHSFRGLEKKLFHSCYVGDAQKTIFLELWSRLIDSFKTAPMLSSVIHAGGFGHNALESAVARMVRCEDFHEYVPSLPTPGNLIPIKISSWEAAKSRSLFSAVESRINLPKHGQKD